MKNAHRWDRRRDVCVRCGLTRHDWVDKVDRWRRGFLPVTCPCWKMRLPKRKPGAEAPQEAKLREKAQEVLTAFDAGRWVGADSLSRAVSTLAAALAEGEDTRV